MVRAYDVLPSQMFLDESDCIPPDALTDKRMVSTEARAISQRPDQRQQHQPTPTPPQPAHTEEEGVHCCICLRSCLTLGAFALLILLTFFLRAGVCPTVFKLLGRCTVGRKCKTLLIQHRRHARPWEANITRACRTRRGTQRARIAAHPPRVLALVGT